jgi:hypothetical protein
VAVDIFHGRSNTFYTSEQLAKNEDQLLFYVKHNWFYRTGKEYPGSQYVLECKNEVLKIGEHHLLILNVLNEKVPATDLVLINHVKFIPEDIVNYWRERKTKVIIGSSVSFGVKKFLSQQLPYHQIHHLKTRGAFELEFN